MTTAAPERSRWPRLAAAPHPQLRSLLPRGYAGFTEATVPRHLVLPASASVPLVVKIRDSARRPPAFVMGAHSAPTVVEGDCAPSYLEVWLDPLGAYRLLGLPVDELGGRITDLADILGGAGRRLAERLRETSGWPQRFTLMDQFLLRRMACGPQPSPEVDWAWRRLLATGGTVPIGQIAGEVGWSHKHLIDKFRRQAGLRPKTAARLVRFDGIWRRLDRRPGRLDWGRFAAEAGYADQAHLVRDFRQFTGTTPTGFQARMPPAGENGGPQVNSVQDAPGRHFLARPRAAVSAAQQTGVRRRRELRVVTLPAVAGHVAFWVIILGSAARRFLAVSAGPLRLLAAGALALRALNSILRARD